MALSDLCSKAADLRSLPQRPDTKEVLTEQMVADLDGAAKALTPDNIVNIRFVATIIPPVGADPEPFEWDFTELVDMEKLEASPGVARYLCKDAEVVDYDLAETERVLHPLLSVLFNKITNPNGSFKTGRSRAPKRTLVNRELFRYLRMGVMLNKSDIEAKFNVRNRDLNIHINKWLDDLDAEHHPQATKILGKYLETHRDHIKILTDDQE